MGLSLTLLFIAFIALIISYLFARNKIRKLIAITLIIFGFIFASLIVKRMNSIELDNIYVMGYFINEAIDEAKIQTQYEKTYEYRSKIFYTVKNTSLLRLALSTDSNIVVAIYAYDDNIVESPLSIPLILATPLGDLIIGKSNYDDVINVFGNNYSTWLFSDSAEKVITYNDYKSKIRLRCCFNENLLVSTIIESF
ncbi:MAG: hypothetical protein FWG91_05315 [Lachnospiraceae bacterium]|nr:hypothetical protein [Lachnospiraceae bacterium]